RLRKHHGVETIIGEHAQARLEIGLDDIHPQTRRRMHVVVGDLDAVATTALGIAQVGKQGAVTATEIEHRRTRRDPVGDLLEVGGERHDKPRAAGACCPPSPSRGGIEGGDGVRASAVSTPSPPPPLPLKGTGDSYASLCSAWMRLKYSLTRRW